MSETIGEMILPGTYIEVRAEGLIGVGGIATGNLGIVGTANRGPLDRPVVLGSFQEALDTFGAYDAWADPATADTPPLTLTRTLEQAFRGGASTVYAVRVANLADDETMAATTWTVQGDGGSPDLFQLVATSPGSWADDVEISVVTDDEEPPALEIELGRVKERFQGATAGDIADAVNRGSRFVTAEDLDDDDRGTPVGAVSEPTAGGPDGAAATPIEIAEGLAALESEPVNILAIGGMDASTIGATVAAHLESTENDGRERMAVLGASTDDPSSIIDGDAQAVGGPRIILTAPGIRAADAASSAADPTVDLTAPYAAAMVAGRLATLSPHVSLTNKSVPAQGLTTEYTRTAQKRLLQNRVLVLHRHLGMRVLRGITTDTGAFTQISVRRTVDYAKEGVRRGSNPYIGRLNNSRVRAALKATLDGFLSGMVLDEMLTGYELEVSATRRQEIEGVAVVTMTLQPTFSIDFVKVIMTLQ